MKLSPPFGIDLGTTRTAAAIFLPGEASPQVATDEEDRPTIPSIVAPSDDTDWKIGFAAHQDANAVESVKRRMGSIEPERAELKNTLPEDISAALLSSIRDRLENWLTRRKSTGPNLTPTQAVITVPAYFDAPQIEATRRAGELAGIEVGGLIQEPTAAAVYHTWKNDLGDGTYLVYDLGGGTFDVSIIRSLFGEYQVLSIDGDNHLGGDDFDRRLADHIRQRLIEEGYELGVDLNVPADKQAFEELTRIARMVKEELSYSESIGLQRQTNFADRTGKKVDLNLTIHRSDFEEAVSDLLDTTILACRRAIEDAKDRHGLDKTEVDGLFLVGGSTRVPAVSRTLRETICKELELTEKDIIRDEPETSVALGAALCAAAICPLRLVDDDLGISIAIDEQPTFEDPILSGNITLPEGSSPTRIIFSHSGEEFSTLLEKEDDSYRFVLRDFTAPEDGELIATLRAGTQDLFGPLELWIPARPEGSKPAPTLSLTNPAVLAKDINIEVVEDQKSANFTLLHRGIHLPTTREHNLVVADRSGSLVLRLYQHRLPIHTIVLPLPDDTAPGTPVELTVKVDQAMNITASGSVGKQIFWARVDRPSIPRTKDWEEIEALIERSEEVSQKLWGVEARRFDSRTQNILAGIRSAARTDPQRLQVLVRRLEAVLDEYAPNDARSPGLPRVEALLDTIRRLVFAADDKRLGRSHSDWQRQLATFSDEVHSAWAGDDDRRWQEVADRVQATFESVAQDEFLFRRRDPDTYAQTLIDTTGDRFRKLQRQLENFPFAEDEDNQKLQRTELKRIQRALVDIKKKFPPSPPTPDSIRELEKIAQSLTHLERRLERVHTLGVPRKGESS